jgi:hypothetical protein
MKTFLFSLMLVGSLYAGGNQQQAPVSKDCNCDKGTQGQQGQDAQEAPKPTDKNQGVDSKGDPCSCDQAGGAQDVNL